MGRGWTKRKRPKEAKEQQQNKSCYIERGREMAIETACHDKRTTLFFCSMNSGEMIIKIERKKKRERDREREKERCSI